MQLNLFYLFLAYEEYGLVRRILFDFFISISTLSFYDITQSNFSLMIQCFPIKGVLSGLRQFMAIESPLKMMKKAFYFISKALFVLKIFKFLSLLFGHVGKRLD